jgi:branched-subunit amino acid transport protein
MSKQVQSALSGLIVAVLAALVAFGVVGGEQASAVQGVVLAVIPFVAAVFIHSARKPK